MALSRGWTKTSIRILWAVAGDILRLISSAARSHSQLAAENLFLRKQLAFYVERQLKPRRADDATRIAALSSLMEWRRILTIVKPDTLIGGIERARGCSGAGSRNIAGELRLPSDLRRLIRDVANLRENEPDVVIFDISPPYKENWDFFNTLRDAKEMEGRGLVLTSPNKWRLDEAAGKESGAFELVGKPYDLDQIKVPIYAALKRPGEVKTLSHG
jgi:hypothetical protein